MPSQPFTRRRQQVLQSIRPGALLLLATPVAVRNHDVEHEYRADSDLYYLTGLEEPYSALLLGAAGDASFVMFVRPRDPEREVWDGPRLGVEGAVAELGADAAFPHGELSQQLPELLKDVPRLYYQLGRDRRADELVLGAIDQLRRRVRQGVGWPTEIVEPGTVLHELRLRKSAEELELLGEACRITCEAHRLIMARARPGMFEYELEAVLRGHFLACGSRRPAYPPTVGSGPNAAVLHYQRNDRRMRDGELVLVDAGCEYGYYAADVTRTFPVGGRFGREQAAVYDLVEAARQRAVAAVRPGVTLDDVHRIGVETLTEGLVDLGLVEGPATDAVQEERYKPFFMHRIGHYLGMDVHDVGHPYRAGRPRALEAGMVLTVEPGLYFGESADVPDAYRGIGVRIEDDVVVTDGGSRVLSGELPTRREDIERAGRG